MGWKLFAVLSTAAFIIEISKPSTPLDIWRALGTIIDIIGITGLAIYAFYKKTAGSPFWKVFSYVFLVWIAISLAWGAYAVINQHGDDIRPVYAFLGLFVAIGWQAANWVAVNRLGKDQISFQA